jgi:ribonuclease Z
MTSRVTAPLACVQFTFLGTSSAVPTLRRNVTSSLLRLDGEALVFDAGEGTQHQLLRNQTRPGRISRIMLTHMHGDHSFGLPGLVTGLCSVKKEMTREDEFGQVRRPPPDKNDRLRIYGPRGVREYLAASLRLSRMRLPPEFYVHELVETAEEAAALVAGRGSGPVPALHDASEPPCHTVVAPTLDAEGRKSWHLFDGPVFTLRAGALCHTVPCWGYVFHERDVPGAVDVERLMASPLGGKRLGPWLQALKNGAVIDGVRREDVCGPSIGGRKVVVLGDTCDSSGIAHLAERCNLLVHEATMRDIMRPKVCLFSLLFIL